MVVVVTLAPSLTVLFLLQIVCRHFLQLPTICLHVKAIVSDSSIKSGICIFFILCFVFFRKKNWSTLFPLFALDAANDTVCVDDVVFPNVVSMVIFQCLPGHTLIRSVRQNSAFHWISHAWVLEQEEEEEMVIERRSLGIMFGGWPVLEKMFWWRLMFVCWFFFASVSLDNDDEHTVWWRWWTAKERIQDKHANDRVEVNLLLPTWLFRVEWFNLSVHKHTHTHTILSTKSISVHDLSPPPQIITKCYGACPSNFDTLISLPSLCAEHFFYTTLPGNCFTWPPVKQRKLIFVWLRLFLLVLFTIFLSLSLSCILFYELTLLNVIFVFFYIYKFHLNKNWLILFNLFSFSSSGPAAPIGSAFQIHHPRFVWSNQGGVQLSPSSISQVSSCYVMLRFYYGKKIVIEHNRTNIAIIGMNFFLCWWWWCQWCE